jgi:hypothetical protein
MGRSQMRDAAYSEAASGCTSMLEALARATNDDDRATTRLWWTVCMGNRLTECKQSYAAWKSQAAASLPTQLRPEHTEAAVGLPGFEPLGQCVLDCAAAVNVDAGAMLDRVEAVGKRQSANAEWSRAVNDVEPMRHRLQQSFLQPRSEPSLLQRALSRRPADGVALAPSAGQMELDELRVCQVWMYALASRLRACAPAANEFAAAAGLRDPNAPLLGYEEERWDPRARPWVVMESCVHEQAARAGVEADAAWRRRPAAG